MALTKTTEQDKIEVIGEFKHVQVRTATVIKEDDIELSRSYSRKVIHSGTLDALNNLADTDISGESAEVQSICNAVWTTSVKNAYKNKLIADKNITSKS